MTLPALATLAELTHRVPGGIPSGDEGRARAALEDASALIRSEVGKDWVSEGALDADMPAIVATVCLAVAARAFVNPTGASSLGENGSSTAFAGVSSAVYLTRDELRAVRRASSGSSVGSVALEGLTPATGEYLYDQFEGDPIPTAYEPLDPRLP